MANPFDVSSVALLVNLSIGVWDGRKFDKAATAVLANEVNAEAGRIGRFNKALIDVKNPIFKAIGQAATKARTYTYKATLPWCQDGSRILPVGMFMDYSREMRALRQEFLDAVEAFLAVYPGMVKAAQADLKSLFKASDYPSANQLREHYRFAITTMAIPSAKDFRVNLSEDIVKAMRDEISDTLTSATEEAMRALWERLFETLDSMVNKLATPDAIFRDSLVSNVMDMLSLLPRLNMTGDENLEKAGRNLEKALKNVAPQDLREDDALRARVATKVAEIRDSMSLFL